MSKSRLKQVPTEYDVETLPVKPAWSVWKVRWGHNEKVNCQMKKTVENFELLFQNCVRKIMKENREILTKATEFLSEIWNSDLLNMSFDRSTEEFYYQPPSINIKYVFILILLHPTSWPRGKPVGEYKGDVGFEPRMGLHFHWLEVYWNFCQFPSTCKKPN